MPISERVAEAGKAPLGVRRAGVNDGGQKFPLYRSRLVAKEFEQREDDDLHAAAPPIEMFRAVVSSATTDPGKRE